MRRQFIPPQKKTSLNPPPGPFPPGGQPLQRLLWRHPCPSVPKRIPLLASALATTTVPGRPAGLWAGRRRPRLLGRALKTPPPPHRTAREGATLTGGETSWSAAPPSAPCLRSRTWKENTVRPSKGPAGSCLLAEASGFQHTQTCPPDSERGPSELYGASLTPGEDCAWVCNRVAGGHLPLPPASSGVWLGVASLP